VVAQAFDTTGRFAWRLDVVAPALVVSAGELDKLLSASA